jgi:hypothetical protein
VHAGALTAGRLAVSTGDILSVLPGIFKVRGGFNLGLSFTSALIILGTGGLMFANGEVGRGGVVAGTGIRTGTVVWDTV